MSDPRHRVPEGDDEMARTYEAKQLPTSRATAIVRAATAVASCRAGRSTRHFVDLSLTLTNGPFSGRGLRVPIFLDGSDPRAAGLRACLGPVVQLPDRLVVGQALWGGRAVDPRRPHRGAG
jgi:hypothetical protein